MLNMMQDKAIDSGQVIRSGGYAEEVQEIIAEEGLLPSGLVNRLHT